MISMVRLMRAVSVLAVVALAAHADFSTLPAALAKDLASPDSKARIRARQLLPREGVAALDHVLPLLSSEDQDARLTAFNIVKDIANGATAPGHDADRLAASAKLMKLIAPGQPQGVVLQGLRILPIIIPDGFNVTPVTAILTGPDPVMREKARECLGLMATDNACDALIDTAATADPTFAVSLIDAASALRNRRTLDRTAALLTHADAGVRAAAARAVSWSGDPKFVAPIKEVVSKASPDTQFTAYDALLRLADSIVAAGGNWDVAMDLYREVLSTASQPAIRAAAMMGLGRNGDGGAVGPILAAASAVNGALDNQAAMALTSLQGREGVQGAIAAHPKLSEAARAEMLAIWGQQKQRESIDLIAGELSTGTPALRSAALHALANIGSMKALPALVAAAKSGSGDERAFALASVKQMAGDFGGTGDKQAAGLAFVQLYGLTDDASLRADAIRGIAQNPVPQAFDIVKEALNNPDMKNDALEALASVAGALAANKEKDKAIEAAKLIKASGAPVELMVRVAASLGDSAPPEWVNLLGLVRKWLVIGPFEWKGDAAWATAFVGEPNVDPAKPITVGDNTLTWKPATGNGQIGIVDLMGPLGAATRAFGYAYAEVTVANECNGQIRVGSDDGNQIWLNGTKIFENRVDRGSALDQDRVDAHFVKGKNIILAKISQGAGGWNFCLRLCTPEGMGIEFTQP